MANVGFGRHTAHTGEDEELAPTAVDDVTMGMDDMTAELSLQGCFPGW